MSATTAGQIAQRCCQQLHAFIADQFHGLSDETAPASDMSAAVSDRRRRD